MRTQSTELKQAQIALQALERAVKTRNVRELCKVLFDVDLTPTQAMIVRKIAFRERKRLTISAFTRFGKSLSVACGVLLLLLLHGNRRIALIAPQSSQASILRDYIADGITKCELLQDLLQLHAVGADRLKKEVSKTRLTFKNNNEVRTFSAEGDANRLMGFGATDVIKDEDGLISYEVHKTKISRMLGDDPDSMMVSLGNPWHRDNQFYQHWIDPAFEQIHVPYQVGLEEGRITPAFIEEQRALLGEDSMEFKVLYLAEFPEESRDQLIRWAWIQAAIEKRFNNVEFNAEVAGIDVAEFGEDKTVVLKGARSKEGVYDFSAKGVLQSWEKKDTMATVGLATPLLSREKKQTQFVDASGVGRGVADRLKELGFNVVAVKVGSQPDTGSKLEIEKKRVQFLNQKAEHYWRLRSLFETGKISIPKHPQLLKELSVLKYMRTSSEKIKIIDPRSEEFVGEHKSPDFADALMLACIDKEASKMHFAFA